LNTYDNKTQENKSQPFSSANTKNQSSSDSTFQFVDNRPEAFAQRELNNVINNSFQVSQLRAFKEMADNSSRFEQAVQLQAMADNHSANKQQTIQRKENNTGLPDNLKTGIENLSGMSLDDVKVHRNSDKPAQLNAHAYAQGTDIHLASGQEKHLPHEAWHVVQQKQGRVKPTMQMKGNTKVNDDVSLEKEADVMGAKAMQGIVQAKETTNKSLKNSSTSQLKTIQKVSDEVKAGGRRCIKGALAGAALGALVSSFIPGVDILVGMGIGAAAGTVAALIKEGLESKARRRIQIAYNITVSPDISGIILNRIKDVLASLPLAHTLGNNELTNITLGGDGNASLYDGEDTIEMNNPMGMPDLLYAALNKKYEWERKLMDDGAMPDFDAVIDNEYDLNSDDRKVMAGVSDANSQEDLVSWTVRHEIGHSMDKNIGWDTRMKGQAVFGAWQNHTEDEVFIQLLAKANIGANIYSLQYPLNPIQNDSLFNIIRGKNFASIDAFFEHPRWQNFLTSNAVPADLKKRIKNAVRSFDIAKNSPWTFADGCANDLAHNGRIYMQGQYRKWESYAQGARTNAVSNYQFSNSSEWFAEAYAAYYNPALNAASRNALSGAQQAWFLNNLGNHQ